MSEYCTMFLFFEGLFVKPELKEIVDILAGAQTGKLGGLIGRRFSPARYYLMSSPHGDDKYTDAETYYRSEDSPISPHHLFYKHQSLGYAGSSHVGNCGNPFEILGDRGTLQAAGPSTTYGDAVLYDAILLHKQLLCSYITSHTKSISSMIQVGFYHRYPCLMVYVKESSLFNQKGKKVSEAAHKEWGECLISFFVGLVNFHAHQSNFPIEMQRRSSFGFLTPSVSPVQGSFRIELGLTPQAYGDVVIKALVELDSALQALHQQSLPKIPLNSFYYTKEYKLYYTEESESTNKSPKELPKADNLMELLFAKVEKSRVGKILVTNIMRTALARDTMASFVFNKLLEKTATPSDAFLYAIETMVGHVSVKGGTLSCLLPQPATYKAAFSYAPSSCNPEFWQSKILALMLDRLKVASQKIKDPTLLDALSSCVEKLGNAIQNQDLIKLYYLFELINEVIFVSAIKDATPDAVGDGYGSDSETEETIQSTPICAKKILTHNGMRAIWGALMAADDHLQKNQEKCRVYLPKVYFEIPLGLDLINELHSKNIAVVGAASLANVVLYDLNTCETKGVECPDYSIDDNANKILILDATSSTTDLVAKHVRRFASSRASALLLVESGFKHQQLGADKNPYGVIRVIARDKKTRDGFYSAIKKIEKPLSSPVSHHLRRFYKQMGAATTTHSIFAVAKKPVVQPPKVILPKKG